MNDLRKYNLIRDEIKTGDLLAFSGRGIMSRLIRLVTRSKYSHVGITIVGDDSYMGKVIYSAEVTSDAGGLPDALTGENREGVQIHLLSQRLATYPGKVSVFSLEEELSAEEQIILVTSIRADHRKRIRYNYKQAIKAGLDLLDDWGLEATGSSIKNICSGWVVKKYMTVKRVDPLINYAEIVPKECVESDYIDSESKRDIL